MEEKDSIDTEYSKYKSVLSILGIGNRKDRLDPTMDTTLEELKKLWSTYDDDSMDIVDSTDSIDKTYRIDSSSDETPQPKVPTIPKLTIDGLHKIEGGYKWGTITDTLHNELHYIIEFHTNSRPNVPIEATIYRVPLEDSKIRIDVREWGKCKVQYNTHRDGFLNRKEFAGELFSIADDYIKGEYYK
jgi:hypothetical protein